MICTIANFESAFRRHLEIAQSKLVRYGRLDNYIEEKAAREEQNSSPLTRSAEEIASLQLFADRFRAKAPKHRKPKQLKQMIG